MSFNIVDASIIDMIKDQLPVEDIVAMTRFQTSIVCGASIESLTVVDLNQEVEGQSIISMIYVEAVVNGHTFEVIFHTDNDDILKAVLTYSRIPESEIRVMEYVRSAIE